LIDEFDLQVRYRVFPLHPDTPENGMSLEQLFGGRIDIDAMLARLHGVARELELPFAERSHTYNSRRAQELGKWAEQQGKLEEFIDAVYRAYFAEAQDISGLEVLGSIAAGIGLDADEALQVLTEKGFAAAVEDDWQRARELGITSVPTLVHGTRALVGFRPYTDYRKLIKT
jgi:predicted DsbA family dithiol-disulfide isomerase